MDSMKDLAQELRHLTRALDTPLNVSDSAKWNTLAQKADWYLSAHNRISGTVLNYAYIFDTKLELALDVRFLKSAETYLASVSRREILDQTPGVKNEEFNSFILNTLTPKSVGVLMNHTAVELLVPDAAGTKTKATIPQVGLAELVLADGMVSINFAQFLKPISSSGLALCAAIDRDIFAKEVVVPASLFEGKEVFKRKYDWIQKSDVADLVIEIETTFRPK